MKITRKQRKKHQELSVKRAYLPYVITDNCPHCGEEVETDLEYNYLMYPIPGEKYDITLYHEGDDDHYEEWTVQVIFDVIIKTTGEQQEER